MNNQTSTTPTLFPNLFSYSPIAWILYIRSVLLPFGACANLINIIVFLSPRLKDQSYRYMLANSAANMFTLSLNFLAIFINSCSPCPTSQTYTAALLTNICVRFLSPTFTLFRVLSQAVLSLMTYATLINHRHWFDHTFTYKVCLPVLFIFSLVAFGQEPWAYTISQRMINAANNDSIVYSSDKSAYGLSSAGSAWAIGRSFFWFFMATVFLSSLNVIIVIKFRARYDKKRANIVGVMPPQTLKTTILNAVTVNRIETLGIYICV
jgi:hypothetical protein